MTREAIRGATPDDAERIRSIARESWHAAYDPLLGPDAVDETIDEWYALEDLRDDVAAARERDDAVVLVAAREAAGTASENDRLREVERGSPNPETDEAVGFVHVGPWREDPAVAYLLRLYVRPDAWGDGIGTALLEAAERDLGDAFDRWRLVVLADNEVGVSFYESRGFERVETRESDLGEGLEEYVYERAW